MQYMLLITDDPDFEPNADLVQAAADRDPDEPCWAPWAREVTARGIILKDGAQLSDAASATTVAVRDGEVLLSDGPFAETKEQIVGYDVIECENLDEAVYTASRHPVALHGGRIEIRPIRAAGAASA